MTDTIIALLDKKDESLNTTICTFIEHTKLTGGWFAYFLDRACRARNKQVVLHIIKQIGVEYLNSDILNNLGLFTCNWADNHTNLVVSPTLRFITADPEITRAFITTYPSDITTDTLTIEAQVKISVATQLFVTCCLCGYLDSLKVLVEFYGKFYGVLYNPTNYHIISGDMPNEVLEYMANNINWTPTDIAHLFYTSIRYDISNFFWIFGKYINKFEPNEAMTHESLINFINIKHRGEKALKYCAIEYKALEVIRTLIDLGYRFTEADREHASNNNTTLIAEIIENYLNEERRNKIKANFALCMTDIKKYHEDITESFDWFSKYLHKNGKIRVWAPCTHNTPTSNIFFEFENKNLTSSVHISSKNFYEMIKLEIDLKQEGFFN